MPRQRIKSEHLNKRVLVFNDKYLLVIVFRSALEAGKCLRIPSTVIREACNGKRTAVDKYYFRYLDEEVGIDETDFDKLTVTYYDKLIQSPRTVFPSGKMTRKGMKYNKQKK